MRFLRRFRRSERPKQPSGQPRRRSLQKVLRAPLEELERAAVQIDIVEAELVAARAAETGGGGSPCWGHTSLGPGEEYALAVEVARCLNGTARLI